MSAESKPPQPIRPYGDRKDDGRIQLSFTLPVPASGRAREAARRMCEKMGLQNLVLATMEPAGDNFSFFVVYGTTPVTLDFAEIEVPEVKAPEWGPKEVNYIVRELLGRKVVVVGACTGSDAHTVGIDAILNMKGYAGDKGLEAYPWFSAYNLGAQVDNAALLARAKELSADAVLVSQIITQRDVHKENSRQLTELARRQGVRDLMFLLGGPRIDHKLARELGYDAGFGPGTRPSQVASFIVQELLAKRGISAAEASAKLAEKH
jgi:beta-lysine 5,6-aminomutase beta subunit